MDQLHLLTNANRTISDIEQSLKPFNKSTSSSDDLLLTSVALAHRSLDFYAVLSQVTVGVALNALLLASVVVARHQTHAPVAQRAIYSSSGHSPMPVIDQIITFMSIVSLCRLLVRGGPILATFSSNCFLWPSFCYLHGFLNTFLQNFHLWTTTLLLNDRYIAHLDPSSYLSKCSHTILYVTLIGLAFLSGMHFAAPIYGFAAYRFLPGELTCALDHHSHYACSYVLYTLLLVSGWPLITMFYWTVLLTARQIRALEIFQSTTNSSVITSPHPQPCSSSTPVVTTFHSPKKKTLYRTILNSKPVHLILPCCSNVQNAYASTTTTLSTNTFDLTVSDSGITSKGRTTSVSSKCSSSSSSTKGRFRKNNSVLSGRKGVYQRPNSSTGSDRVIYLNSPVLGCQYLTSSSSISRSVKSHVLTSSKELKSVIILSWVFLLASAPKLAQNTCTACFSPSPYSLITDEQPNPPEVFIAQPLQPSNSQLNFYLAYLDETTSCLVVPLVLLAFHSKLRFSLILLISALLATCRSSFSHFKFRGVATNSRRASSKKPSAQNRSSGHLRSASVGRASSGHSRHKSPRIAADPQSLPPPSANECDELLANLNRSSSLRINYPTNNSVAKTSNHFLSERSIAVTII